jgi:hypothetical protein
MYFKTKENWAFGCKNCELTRNGENSITQKTFSLTKSRGVRWVGNTTCMVNEK